MYRLLFVFSFLAFIACKNGSKTTSPPVPTDSPAPEQPASVATETGKVKPPVTAPAPTSTPIDLSNVPAPSASKKAYFTTKYWSCFGAQHPNDDMVSAQYLNVKLQFLPDMTFKVYRNKEYAFSGTWTYDDANSEVFLSSTDKYYNTSFKTIDAGMRQVWIGNTALNGTGVQMRWDNHQRLED